jgi:hypothetical protein
LFNTLFKIQRWLSWNDGISTHYKHVEGSDMTKSFTGADSRRKLDERWII